MVDPALRDLADFLTWTVLVVSAALALGYLVSGIYRLIGRDRTEREP